MNPLPDGVIKLANEAELAVRFHKLPEDIRNAPYQDIIMMQAVGHFKKFVQEKEQIDKEARKKLGL